MLISCIVLISGCLNELPPKTEMKNKGTKIEKGDLSGKYIAKKMPSPSNGETERLSNCQKELNILNGVSPEKYILYKRTFDGLMSGAAQYAGLRNEVNQDIQETVDALYRYKVNRLCAEVSQVALQALVERGEQFK